MLSRTWCYISIFLFSISNKCVGQPSYSDSANFKMIAAGPEYQKPTSFQHWWGSNRRDEWTARIHVPVAMLDTIYSGLRPYKSGGGNETKSLRLRSINKK